MLYNVFLFEEKINLINLLNLTSNDIFENYQKGELESFFEENGFKTLKTYYAGFPFWSPITRNLLNLLPVDNTSDVQVEMGLPKKIVSLLLYYSFRYFSFKNKGDQFVGLFEKI